MQVREGRAGPQAEQGPSGRTSPHRGQGSGAGMEGVAVLPILPAWIHQRPQRTPTTSLAQWGGGEGSLRGHISKHRKVKSYLQLSRYGCELLTNEI